jgi:hypothetical protein
MMTAMLWPVDLSSHSFTAAAGGQITGLMADADARRD